jgi:D-serine deaminase-like pyridoxal phosphate-dependent protein
MSNKVQDGADEAHALRVLDRMAEQKTVAETEADSDYDGSADYEGAWDIMVENARFVQRTLRARQQVPESVRQVMEELSKARSKFPSWPDDPIHAAAVVQEEAGELVQAALQAVYEPHRSSLTDARKEAIQTAAMAIRFIESHADYTYPPTAQHDDRAIARSEGEKR